MIRRIVAFLVPVCMLLFSCDSGFYGDFEIDLNEYENGVVFKGAGSLKEIRTHQTFYQKERG